MRAPEARGPGIGFHNFWESFFQRPCVQPQLKWFDDFTCP